MAHPSESHCLCGPQTSGYGVSPSMSGFSAASRIPRIFYTEPVPLKRLRRRSAECTSSCQGRRCALSNHRRVSVAHTPAGWFAGSGHSVSRVLGVKCSSFYSLGSADWPVRARRAGDARAVKVSGALFDSCCFFDAACHRRMPSRVTRCHCLTLGGLRDVTRSRFP
ncbi:uncharacterized protein C8Q71DRAFT_393431 [Rhodofomes roseus]|uniref:Uncharacterized protein n=1 Tax=Rhodofomes roseus TaxID=34475 RepID=A0ABQ8K137_9APHY|nr:uncharacterized protein C8Q71DRAFT_393431 [Rhodofomes roseus]KAH9829894.1 hypothetical protein C8Q71DRAFT_393431 [Rhodofomes roseus]